MFKQRYIRDNVIENRLNELRSHMEQLETDIQSIPDAKTMTTVLVDLSESHKAKLITIENLIDQAKAESVNPEIIQGLIQVAGGLQKDIEDMIALLK